MTAGNKRERTRRQIGRGRVEQALEERYPIRDAVSCQEKTSSPIPKVKGKYPETIHVRVKASLRAVVEAAVESACLGGDYTHVSVSDFYRAALRLTAGGGRLDPYENHQSGSRFESSLRVDSELKRHWESLPHRRRHDIFEGAIRSLLRQWKHSVPVLKCLREARLRARAGGKNMLILGERGTGKELLAKYIHRHSGRTGKLEMCFLQSCPEALVEDLLFGHVKGAYTGAYSEQAGAAERADRGTLFVDEFGAVPPGVQTKLLRLLGSTREVQRMGSDRKKKVDLLVVLATNRMNLRGSGDFHADLLDRVSVEHSINLPPLRERTEDIPPLTEHFVRHYEAAYKEPLGTETRNIDPEAAALLMDHPWPGNIRQLEEVLAHAVNRFPKLRLLSASHLTMPEEAQAELPARIPTGGSHRGEGRLDFSHLLNYLESQEFETAPERRGEIAGALPRLKSAYSQCAANMLRTALISTSKPTKEHPEGEILITPAVNLLSRKRKLSASQCADEIKRLFRQSPKQVQQLWLSDPVLNQAYDTAVTLRPKRS